MNEEETDPCEEPDDGRQDAGDKNAEEDDGADDDELPVLRYHGALRKVDDIHHALSSDNVTLVPHGDEPAREPDTPVQAVQKAEPVENVPDTLQLYIENPTKLFGLRRLVKVFRLILPPDESDDYEDYLYERAFEATQSGELRAVGREPSVEARPIDYVLWLAYRNKHRLRNKQWVTDVVRTFEILKKRVALEDPSERVETPTREEADGNRAGSEAQSKEHCLFQRKEGGFLVRFEGEESVLSDTKSARIVHTLITAQGRPVDVLELDEAKSRVNEVGFDHTGKEHAADSQGEQHRPTAKGKTIDSRAEIDEDTVAELLKELEELRSEMARPGISDPEENEYQARIDQIEEYLGKYTDQKGQPRMERTEKDKAANRVRVSLNEFKKSKRDTMPRFIEHIDSSISTRDEFVYRPSAEVEWET